MGRYVDVDGKEWADRGLIIVSLMSTLESIMGLALDVALSVLDNSGTIDPAALKQAIWKIAKTADAAHQKAEAYQCGEEEN